MMTFTGFTVSSLEGEACAQTLWLCSFSHRGTAASGSIIIAETPEMLSCNYFHLKCCNDLIKLSSRQTAWLTVCTWIIRIEIDLAYKVRINNTYPNNIQAVAFPFNFTNCMPWKKSGLRYTERQRSEASQMIVFNFVCCKDSSK